MFDSKNAEGPAPPGLAKGATIGRYIVLGMVGRGAMGEVYAAYDPELERKVAVKLLRTQSGAQSALATEAKSRLLREAQAIARLSHPNVIAVHDVGSFGERVFLAMEYVDGNTLGYWLLAAKRSWKEVLKVFMAAGQGLAAAHAARLVHRDFKPENVMIGRDGQVRVMDFGLARRVAGSPVSEVHDPRVSVSALLVASSATGDVLFTNTDDEGMIITRIIPPAGGANASGPRVRTAASVAESVAPTRGHDGGGGSSSRGAYVGSSNGGSLGTRGETLVPSLSLDLTQTGAIIGTPAYMAPEQFDGSAVDERSDQFSFCVALYEALYGTRPFAGRTAAELSDNVKRGRVPPAPDATRVPSWLRRVVLRGLRKSPVDRWASMDALLAALTKDPGVVWRRWAIVAAATAGIAGIGITARRHGAADTRPTCQVTPERLTQVWEAVAAPGSRRAQMAAAFRASGQPYAADALAGAARLLDEYVGAWSAMYTESCEATNHRGDQSAEVLDLRMSCLSDRWNELRALSDVLAEPNSDVVANAVKAAAALSPLDRCADVRTLRTAVPPPSDPTARKRVEMLRGKLATAKALFDAGRFGTALAAAVPLVSEARETSYMPVIAEAFARLGMTQLRMRRASDATGSLDEAIWAAQAAGYDEIAAVGSIEQVTVAAMERDLPRARRWLRQSEAFLSRMSGHELLRAWMLNNFGIALDYGGELEEAASRYRGSLEIKERVLGSSHPDLAYSLTNIAMALNALGRPEEAVQHSNRGVNLAVQALGWEHPDTALQLVNRAEILNSLGRHAEAARDAQRALVVWEKEMDPNNADLSFVLALWGEALLGLDDSGRAVAPLSRALQLAEHNESELELRKLRFALARALWQSGQDKHRALELGDLAASALAPDPTSGVKTSFAAQDLALRARAASWVLERRSKSQSVRGIAGRSRGGPAF